MHLDDIRTAQTVVVNGCGSCFFHPPIRVQESGQGEQMHVFAATGTGLCCCGRHLLSS